MKKILNFIRNLKSTAVYYYYRFRFGEIGKPKNLIQIQKEVVRLGKSRFRKLIEINPKKDKAVEILTKAIDTININFLFFTLNWILGKTLIPPSYYLKTIIRKRGKQSETKKLLEAYLVANQIDKSILLALVKKVANMPDEEIKKMEEVKKMTEYKQQPDEETTPPAEETPAEDAPKEEATGEEATV